MREASRLAVALRARDASRGAASFEPRAASRPAAGGPGLTDLCTFWGGGAAPDDVEESTPSELPFGGDQPVLDMVFDQSLVHPAAHDLRLDLVCRALPEEAAALPTKSGEKPVSDRCPKPLAHPRPAESEAEQVGDPANRVPPPPARPKSASDAGDGPVGKTTLAIPRREVDREGLLRESLVCGVSPLGSDALDTRPLGTSPELAFDPVPRGFGAGVDQPRSPAPGPWGHSPPRSGAQVVLVVLPCVALRPARGRALRLITCFHPEFTTMCKDFG